MDREERKKRTTIYYEQPNPLFEKWLTELYNSAVHRGSSKQFMYKKALRSLQKFPLPLSSGKECLILEYFGPELRDYIDWKLKKKKTSQIGGSDVNEPVLVQSSQESEPQCSQAQMSELLGSQLSNSQKKTTGSPQKKKEKTVRSKRKSNEIYVPALRSGPYAFLITLLSHEGRDDFVGYLTKAQLIKEAQPLCDASLSKPVPGSRYTAWSSMTSVVNKGFISRTGNPARFSLTLEGRELARKLLQADGSNQVTDSNHEVSDDDHRNGQPTTSQPVSSYKNVASESSSEPLPEKRATKTKKRPLRDESPPPCSEENSRDAYVPISMQPGSFEVILLVDTSETTGNSSCNKTKTILENHRINFEVRRLQVGDFAWVARDNESNRELLLPYIVERKRMDDLGSSIKDGRFHEQKFRLKQSGISNLIYLVENYGNNEHLGLPLASVQQAAVNTRVVDGFQVKYTNDHPRSMLYLAAMTQTLRTIYKEKTLVSSLKSDIVDKDLGPRADVAFLITYEEFNKSSSKVRNFTIREMLIRQLLQLHGLSVEKALAIADLYPTPKSLMKAFETGGEELLTNVPFGTNNRKFSSAMSKTLHRFYTARSLS